MEECVLAHSSYGHMWGVFSSHTKTNLVFHVGRWHDRFTDLWDCEAQLWKSTMFLENRVNNFFKENIKEKKTTVIQLESIQYNSV